MWSVTAEYDSSVFRAHGLQSSARDVDSRLDDVAGQKPCEVHVSPKRRVVRRTYSVVGTASAHALLDRLLSFFQDERVRGAYAIMIRRSSM